MYLKKNAGISKRKTVDIVQWYHIARQLTTSLSTEQIRQLICTCIAYTERRLINI